MYGYMGTNENGINGLLDDIRIYENVFSQSKIQQIYVQRANLLNLVQKNK